MKKREYLVALFATVFLMFVLDRLFWFFDFRFWINQFFEPEQILHYAIFPVHTLIYAIISSHLGIFLTFGIILKTEYTWNLKEIFFVAILTSVLFTIYFLLKTYHPPYFNPDWIWIHVKMHGITSLIGYVGTTFLFSLLGNIIGFFFIGYENKIMSTPKPK